MRVTGLHLHKRKLPDLPLLPLKNRFKNHPLLFKNLPLLLKNKKHPDLPLLSKKKNKNLQLLQKNKNKHQDLRPLRNPNRRRSPPLSKSRSKPLALQLPKPNSHKTTPTPQASPSPRQNKSRNPKRRSKTNDRILQPSNNFIITLHDKRFNQPQKTVPLANPRIKQPRISKRSIENNRP